MRKEEEIKFLKEELEYWKEAYNQLVSVDAEKTLEIRALRDLIHDVSIRAEEAINDPGKMADLRAYCSRVLLLSMLGQRRDKRIEKLTGSGSIKPERTKDPGLNAPDSLMTEVHEIFDALDSRQLRSEETMLLRRAVYKLSRVVKFLLIAQKADVKAINRSLAGKQQTAEKNPVPKGEQL